MPIKRIIPLKLELGREAQPGPRALMTCTHREVYVKARDKMDLRTFTRPSDGSQVWAKLIQEQANNSLELIQRDRASIVQLCGASPGSQQLAF